MERNEAIITPFVLNTIMIPFLLGGFHFQQPLSFFERRNAKLPNHWDELTLCSSEIGVVYLFTDFDQSVE